MLLDFDPLGTAWGTPAEDALDAEREARHERSLRQVRRSSLIVPSNVPAFVAKAHLRNADAITLDLEDSIPPDEKVRAREQAREAIGPVGRGGAEVFVRINHPYALAVGDLDAVIRPGLTGISYPKAETAREIVILDRLITEREIAAGMAPGSVKIGLAVENARGLLNALAIATASPRIAGINYGQEDATLELGGEPSREGREREWGNLYLIGAICTSLFLGGWQVPHFTENGFVLGLVQFLTFFLKAYFMVFVAMWIRATLPRVRVDQLMTLCWKYLVPIAFANMICAALYFAILPHGSIFVRLGMFAFGLGLLVHFLNRVLFHLRRAKPELHFSPIV